MKILVTGSNGMAGHVITRYFKKLGHDVKTLARSNADYCIDIENTEATIKFLNNIKNDFDFIINCIGLLVKDSIDNPQKAILVNSWFPHAIEYAIKDSKTRLIHLSTDCVFSGEKGNYIETDFHTEKNMYGRSKSLGEVDNNKDVTFRMSIIGPEIKSNGTGLLKWVLTNSDVELSGWDNAWWNGLTTLQLAKCLEKYINNPIITGIYQLVNNEIKISKYELLCKINEIFALNKVINRTDGPKPVNKILIDTRKLIDFQIPNYDIQLQELKNF